MQKPMLANRFEDKKATFPCMAQPKLDGVRCMFDGTLAWTRNLKEHKPHITRMLRERYPNLPEGLVLDGELMLPSPWTFQKTVSVVKKYYPQKVDPAPLPEPVGGRDLYYKVIEEDLTYVSSDLLQYHVYDCYWSHLDMKIKKTMVCPVPFHERMKTVAEVVEDFPVVTTKLENLDEVERLLIHFMKEGYEGLIYRNPDGPYTHGRSGRDLLKYKKSVDENGDVVDVLDGEFQIVGAIEGQGKDRGTPIWVCRISATDERTFKARPMGTYEWRREAWTNRVSYYGKMLTVKYQELSDEGIPRFPIGVGVRDYE